MKLQEEKTQKEEYPCMLFIGNYCYDLLMALAGVLAALGESVCVVDASFTGELFHVLSGYGGRTEQMVNFRQTDFVRCQQEAELKALMDRYQREGAGKQRKSIGFYIYLDPVSFSTEKWKYLSEITCKKIVLADAYFHSMMPVLSLIQKEHFSADLFLFRALPGKKISFSYFLKSYRKEFLVFEKMMEIPWAPEDLEYRVRLDYEKSQGFLKLSEGYRCAVEELCHLAGNYGKSELKKAFRSFEKNER